MTATAPLLTRLRGAVGGLDPHPAAPWPAPEEPPPAGDVASDPGALARDAIGWLDANLGWFDPQCWERHLPRRPFPGGALLELLVLCRALAEPGGGGPPAPFVARAVALAERIVARPDFDERLRAEPGLFTFHAWLSFLVERLGGSAGAAPATIDALLYAGRVGIVSPAGAPVRALELRHALELGGREGAFLGRADVLLARWWDSHTRNALVVADADAYALTHAVFYATDFGRRPLPLDGSACAQLGTLAGTLLAAALARGDADLGGELAHVVRIAGAPADAALDGTWARLARAQQADRAIPGPLFAPATAARLTGEREDAYRFGTAYHTTIVTALAALDLDRTRTRTHAA